MAEGFGKGVVIAIATGAFLAGCVGGCTFGVVTSSGRHDNSSISAPNRTSSIPIPQSSISRCRPPGPGTVDVINGGFTAGERLVDAQAVNGAQATYIGGNIQGSDGAKYSSQDAWAMTNGQVYALTSDARRRTTFPDGRDIAVLNDEWADANSALGACIGAAERARNGGG
ncbi:hypothetical protein A5792_10670 [Mycolicibacterium peregrinum]|uniref:Uncharacterized protein n=1 Tax=Mycolicibacterium peregrinum TaxID=43304 RepID=A0A1A0RGY9_MYCPR|nr:hypothetical protein [Mycolicibacterium peregrinum]OBB33577.1 hypothetical protein A5792_10670 [Mycolicibacterium peregrinum]